MASQIMLCSQPENEGEKLTLTYPDDDLRQHRFNDKVSSVRVYKGVWLMYEHIQYRGKMYVVDQWNGKGKYSNCYAWGGENDMISSLDIVYDVVPEQNPGIILYDQSDYQGGKFETHEDMRDLSTVGFDNKTVSLIVTKGSWIGYEGKNFQGRQWLFTSTASVTTKYGGTFANKMNSLRAIRES